MNQHNLDCFAFTKHSFFYCGERLFILIENLTHATITNLQLKKVSCFFLVVTEQNVSKTVFKIIILFSIQFTTTNPRTDEHYTSKLKKAMKNKLIFILFLIVVVPSGFAQLKTYSFQEAEKLSAENPKPIVVFVHTSWCKYCKMMENITFKTQKLLAY
jgi:thiol:disulfide interchange protein